MSRPTMKSSDRGSDHDLSSLPSTDTSSLHSVGPELDERIQLLTVAAHPLSESDDTDAQHEESQGWNAAMLNSHCDAHVMHSIPTVPPQTNDSITAAVASARQAYEVADLRWRRVGETFEACRSRYTTELRDYVQKQREQATAATCGQNDGDNFESEEEFGRIWFRKHLEITKKYFEAESAYKTAEERWEALVLAQNPHAFVDPTREYGEDMTTESIEEEFSERRREEIEDWVEKTSG